ncbi:MAG: ribosome silencing factor [Rhodocyclaceae bacterium]|nr:ribosome silencing factor [Rhodocyclaceae bacterium]
MDVRKLQKVAVSALEDIKARDIEVINTTKISSLFDRIIIASADSARQTVARAQRAGQGARSRRTRDRHGREETGDWIVVDPGDIVVHIMQPAVRTYYNLEELWSARPAARKKTASEGG